MKKHRVYDNYNELLYLQLQSKQEMVEIIQAILDYNKVSLKEKFLPYFRVMMTKVSAAIHIQQSYRSWRMRMKETEYGNPKKSFGFQIVQRRAILCIT